jgi:N-acetylglucosaminyldiphosphoundecaprenol N-acetyl-beta-D-mannosaminyltransferase
LRGFYTHTGNKLETSAANTDVRLRVSVADVGTARLPEPGRDGRAAAAVDDDFAREVYCVLGIPVDAIEMQAALRTIEAVAAVRKPFLISTPNINFLVNNQLDASFRDSLLLSDLCPADGAILVWVARFMGIPIKARVAGSDILNLLDSGKNLRRRLKVFFFGGRNGVAAAASNALNLNSLGLQCVGWDFPGYGSVAELSHDEIINKINASGADIIVASLGAAKGQAWLLKNHERLLIPIRAHLGAAINFITGGVKRAPNWMQRHGLEWVWRIKEEPHLWRRYMRDSSVLLQLLLTRAVPLAIETWLQRFARADRGSDLLVKRIHGRNRIILNLSGDATVLHVEKASAWFRDVVTANQQVVVDFSSTRTVDARFLGLLLMLRKRLKAQGSGLELVGLSPRLMRTFRLNGLGFLFSPGYS